MANVTPAALRPAAFAANIFVIHADSGDAISPVVIGYIADRTSLRTGFLVTSVTFLLGAVFSAMGSPYLERDTRRAEELSAGSVAAS